MANFLELCYSVACVRICWNEAIVDQTVSEIFFVHSVSTYFNNGERSTEKLFQRWISMTRADIWDIWARETAIWEQARKWSGKRLMKTGDIFISGFWPRELNPGFRGNLQLRYGDSIRSWYFLRGITGSSAIDYHGILGSIPRADIQR